MRNLLIVFLFLSLNSFGQTRMDWKVIPTDINACLERLNFLLSDNFKTSFIQEEDESKAVSLTNFVGLGTQMRNDWKLWRGSELSEYFNNLGVGNPEDMTYMILISFHRQLSGKDIDFQGQLDLYLDMVNNPEKYYVAPIEKYSIGDTLTNHFYEMGMIRAFTNTQGRCDLTSIVKEIDKDGNRILIELVNVTTTREGMKYDEEEYKVGKRTWISLTNGTAWRRRGEIVQIHVH